jgi:hypothetical protein
LSILGISKFPLLFNSHLHIFLCYVLCHKKEHIGTSQGDTVGHQGARLLVRYPQEVESIICPAVFGFDNPGYSGLDFVF